MLIIQKKSARICLCRGGGEQRRDNSVSRFLRVSHWYFELVGGEYESLQLFHRIFTSLVPGGTVQSSTVISTWGEFPNTSMRRWRGHEYGNVESLYVAVHLFQSCFSNGLLFSEPNWLRVLWTPFVPCPENELGNFLHHMCMMHDASGISLTTTLGNMNLHHIKFCFMKW
jgi:hypothetical protein